ncbi:MAG: metallophosphoesterase [Vallitaleaceae bacterium]|nr:metallophosphoesterase [Vallitaleaceae bacterium]
MIYAIGDLHLGFSQGKTMDVFGPHWTHHPEKIKEDWLSKVQEDDLVLIAGDSSWAMTLEDGLSDLNYLRELPGNKLLIKGNHDYWWTSLSQIKKRTSNQKLFFLQNDCFVFKNINICGARGWICPNESAFTENDQKIYQREAQRLKMSLDAAEKSKPILVLMHFPPMNEQLEESLYTKLLKEYEVQQVIYGHVHGEINFQNAPNGRIGNIDYHLVSADYLNFKLTEISSTGRN